MPQASHALTGVDANSPPAVETSRGRGSPSGSSAGAGAARPRDDEAEDRVWAVAAAGVVRMQMAKTGLTYKGLARQMATLGGKAETERSISNKLNRGTFTFAFFLKAMVALESKVVDFSAAVDAAIKLEPGLPLSVAQAVRSRLGVGEPTLQAEASVRKTPVPGTGGGKARRGLSKAEVAAILGGKP